MARKSKAQLVLEFEELKGRLAQLEHLEEALRLSKERYRTVLMNDAHERQRRRRAEARAAHLVDQLITAQEKERRHIAHELHDATSQSLTTLLVGLRSLQDVPSLEEARDKSAELRRLTVQAMVEVRQISWGLHPVVLDDLGLIAALKRYATELAQTHIVSVTMQAHSFDSVRLPQVVETAVYRVVQEALTNVFKHAAAKNAQIVVELHGSEFTVVIRDDGKGFEVKQALQSRDGDNQMGLQSMRERANMLGGSFSIDSNPGKGTMVWLRIPVSDKMRQGVR